MRSLFVRTAIVILPLVLISCMQPQADTAGLKKAIDEYNSVSMMAMTTNNPDTLAMYYTEDAMEMPPNEAPITGRENIVAWMKKMGEMGVKITAAKFNTTGYDAGGNVGYETGDYEMTMETGQMGTMTDNGKYICIFKKQQDGSWKVQAEIWNSNNPLPGMPMGDKK